MSDKTEPASAKKRADAAKEGDRLRSRDLGAGLALVVFAAWLAVMGPSALSACRMVLATGLRFDHATLDAFAPGRTAASLLRLAAVPFGTLATLLVIAAVGGGIMLGGAGWTTAALAPKPSRLDPVKGLSRLFGGHAAVGLVQSLAKVAALMAVTAVVLRGQLSALAGAAAIPALTAFAPLPAALDALLLVVVAAAGVDVLVQWRQREGRLRMSKQDQRDEHKSAEGSPERKRAQKDRHYAIAARSARKAMGEATVVLVNPLHFAVALRYRPDIDGVPVVVARGVDEAARAIRDLATEHAVPQIASPLLARAVYFTSQTGQPVVGELYLAVATVLAFVFELDRQQGRAVPDVDIPAAMRFDAHGKPLI